MLITEPEDIGQDIFVLTTAVPEDRENGGDEEQQARTADPLKQELLKTRYLTPDYDQMLMEDLHQSVTSLPEHQEFWSTKDTWEPVEKTSSAESHQPAPVQNTDIKEPLLHPTSETVQTPDVLGAGSSMTERFSSVSYDLSGHQPEEASMGNDVSTMSPSLVTNQREAGFTSLFQSLDNSTSTEGESGQERPVEETLNLVNHSLVAMETFATSVPLTSDLGKRGKLLTAKSSIGFVAFTSKCEHSHLVLTPCPSSR